MRLLQTKTLDLHYFVPSKVPDYVILSHTWEDEEITYQDILKGDFLLQKGYAKLQGACEQASRDGYKFIWIDTCCIDKASSAELQESINSMYNWYRDAQICYVYLTDVPEASGDELEMHFRTSRWFTRAWTLQEMLAPDLVEFYNQNWKPIGTKHQRVTLLNQITGIAEWQLKHFHPDGALHSTSSATIFSWAASRRVTREEDIAYSLLGLCNLQMPLLYGEGARNAFLRLQGLILQQKEDASIFLWSHCRDMDLFPLLAEHPSWFCRRGPGCKICKIGAHCGPCLSNFDLKHTYSAVMRGLLPRALNESRTGSGREEIPGIAMQAFRLTQLGVSGSFRMFKLKKRRMQRSEESTWYAGLSTQLRGESLPKRGDAVRRAPLICIPLEQSREGFQRLFEGLHIIDFATLPEQRLVDQGLHTIFIYHKSNIRYVSHENEERQPPCEYMFSIENSPLDLVAWQLKPPGPGSDSPPIAVRITPGGQLHYRSGIHRHGSASEIWFVLGCGGKNGSMDYFAFFIACSFRKTTDYSNWRQECRLRTLSDDDLAEVLRLLPNVEITVVDFDPPDRDIFRDSDRLQFKCANGNTVEVALRRSSADSETEWCDSSLEHRWHGRLQFTVWREGQLVRPFEHEAWSAVAWWEEDPSTISEGSTLASFSTTPPAGISDRTTETHIT